MLPRRGGQAVGLLLDLGSHVAAGWGQSAVAVEQAPVGQAVDGGVPLLLAPSAASAGELRDKSVTGSAGELLLGLRARP
jgi:hypothetical protein